MKNRKRVIIILSIVVLLVGLPLIYLARPGAAPQDQAAQAMQSSSSVLVETKRWITFTPTAAPPTVGLIFYPGGNVNEQAYAPVLHAIAGQGYLVVDVPMPFNLAVFGINKADQVIAAYPEIKTWVIGGHSLGGAMAAEFAAANPGKIEGLALWAAYPAENTSLADSGLAVISISGTLDGLSTPEKIAASIPLLPEDTVWVPIEGGNHAQFGDYGTQASDLPAAISQADQQAQVVEAMVAFLSALRD